MFADYLKRQMSYRGNLQKRLGMSRSTLYRKLNNPETIRLDEFKLMIEVGELDEQKVIDWLFRRSK